MRVSIPMAFSPGFTMIELVISMSIALVVMGAAYQSFLVQQRAYDARAQVTDMHQNARAGLDFMVRELRSAMTITSVLSCGTASSSIDYRSVENSTQDRCFSWSDNKIRYGRGGDCAAGGSPDPVAENITSLSLTQCGNLLSITLVARTAGRDPSLGDYRSVTLSANARPRNLSWP